MTLAKPSTIRDVAQAAGLSTATVSRYLNKRLVLPAKTAIRVDRAVVALGFKPNAIARRLSRGTSETLGFVTSDIAHPFFASIASAAEQEAARLGYTLAMFNTRNQLSQELVFLSRIEDQQVDGILFLTNHPDDGTLRDKIRQCRQVVLIDEDVPETEVPKVFADSEHGARLATRHLIEQGHTRIAFVSGPKGMRSSQERFAGFRQEMSAARLPVDRSLVKFGEYEEEFGVHAFQALWRVADPPTAIFATADMLAIGVIRGARQAGLVVPEDLSVIGFADMLHVNLLSPPLTTVRQSTSEFGRRGVRLLVAKLKGETVSPEPERVPVELVVRGSVGAPARRRKRAAAALRASGRPAAE